MKKFKIFIVVIASFAILFAGSSFAYYNTKIFGFDEDAVFFEKSDDGFVFLDQQVKYKDVDNALLTAGEYLPSSACTTVNRLNTGNMIFEKINKYLP